MTKLYAVTNELANGRILSTHRTMGGAVRGAKKVQPKCRKGERVYLPTSIVILDRKPTTQFVASGGGEPWTDADRREYEDAQYKVHGY